MAMSLLRSIFLLPIGRPGSTGSTVAGNYDAADGAGQYDKQGNLQRSADFC